MWEKIIVSADSINWETTLAAVWRSRKQFLKPIHDVAYTPLNSLLGIAKQKHQICKNTELFLSGHEANHVLLWGARGTGKSSLIKAILHQYHNQGLRVIEIPKEDLVNLLDILDDIRDLPQQFIIFCDDLSFELGDASYKALKSSLEGTIEAPPSNVLVYATSNRRHLIPDHMSDNQSHELINGEIHASDTIEEKMSLSDRFGLVLSFYPINQKAYLEMVDFYFSNIQEKIDNLHQEAIQYATQKGTRSGRVAKQFYQYYQLLEEKD